MVWKHVQWIHMHIFFPIKKGGKKWDKYWFHSIIHTCTPEYMHMHARRSPRVNARRHTQTTRTDRTHTHTKSEKERRGLNPPAQNKNMLKLGSYVGYPSWFIWKKKKSIHYNLQAYQAVSRGGNVKTNKVEQS